jgi:hypothetical protein
MEDNENCKIISRYVFIPLVLTFNIYSIKSLIDVTYKDVSNMCSNSNIWYYLLAINLLSISGLQKNNNNLESVLLVLYMIGFFIWGSYELFGVSCISKLNNTNLYTISLAYWIFITIILGIITILALCSVIFIDSDNYINSPLVTEPRKSNLDVSIHGSLINIKETTIESKNDKISNIINSHIENQTVDIENQTVDIEDLNTIIKD